MVVAHARARTRGEAGVNSVPGGTWRAGVGPP